MSIDMQINTCSIRLSARRANESRRTDGGSGGGDEDITFSLLPICFTFFKWK